MQSDGVISPYTISYNCKAKTVFRYFLSLSQKKKKRIWFTCVSRLFLFLEAPRAVITVSSLYQLCTPGFKLFVPFLLADPLKLCLTGRGVLMNRSLPIAPSFFSILQAQTQGHSEVCPEVSPPLSWLCASTHMWTGWKVNLSPIWGYIQSGAGFLQGTFCFSLCSLSPQSWPVSQ